MPAALSGEQSAIHLVGDLGCETLAPGGCLPSISGWFLHDRPGASMATIEARPYGADMTAEERDALLARVFVVEPGIVFYREIPIQTVESVDLMIGRMHDLGFQWPSFIEVLDLSTVARPSPAVRAVIRRWMQRLSPRMS